jgi:hypothetical protein
MAPLNHLSFVCFPVARRKGVVALSFQMRCHDDRVNRLGIAPSFARNRLTAPFEPIIMMAQVRGLAFCHSIEGV